MLTLRQHVAGLLQYRKVYFPSQEAALEISRSIQINEAVRLLGVFRDLGAPLHLVKHQERLTVWVDLSAGLEAVLRGMKKKSCRYEVHRAERMLDRVEIEINSARALRDFLPLYNGFADTKGPVPRLSPRRFKKFLVHSEVTMLYLDGRPLCCHLLLCDPEAGITQLLYSGSRRLETPAEAAACGALNRYLHWYEMQRCHARGLSIYDFGGIRYPEHPTARFKLSFGGSIVREHHYLLAGVPWLLKLADLFYGKFSKVIMPPSQNHAPERNATSVADDGAGKKPEAMFLCNPNGAARAGSTPGKSEPSSGDLKSVVTRAS
jgi:hypothetical protein